MLYPLGNTARYYAEDHCFKFSRNCIFMTLDELKKHIDTGELSLECSNEVINTGILLDGSGNQADYEIRHGWDIVAAFQCDQLWKRWNLELFKKIEEKNYNKDQLTEVLNSIQSEDHHWEWFKKSYLFASDEYQWFFLFCEDKPQGVCLIYHPKDSALSKNNIFYVEYLAVAPWNRDCLIHSKEHKGIGSILLKTALKYSVDRLGLAPGFSLHSLPQAKTYYEKLKMINVKEKEKDTLLYFELPLIEAQKLLEAI